MAIDYSGHKIMIDTNCFIYLIEGKHYPQFLPLAEELFRAVSDGNSRGLTSPITLTEIMTLPRKLGKEDLAYTYKALITNFPNLDIVNIDTTIADRAAALRGIYGLKTPDALQVAAGLVHGATLFVTFDQEFKKLMPLINIVIPGVE